MSTWLADITQDHEVVISTQVLIELRSVATRKLRPALSKRQISALLEDLSGFEVVSTDSTLVLDAHQLAINEQLSWFDALIIEAAMRSRCDVLFSEDLSHGARISGIRLVKPFLKEKPDPPQGMGPTDSTSAPP
jgi:Predicted nucleic-acid-binding protein, contains PIN domain